MEIWKKIWVGVFSEHSVHKLSEITINQVGHMVMTAGRGRPTSVYSRRQSSYTVAGYSSFHVSSKLSRTGLCHQQNNGECGHCSGLSTIKHLANRAAADWTEFPGKYLKFIYRLGQSHLRLGFERKPVHVWKFSATWTANSLGLCMIGLHVVESGRKWAKVLINW